MDRASVLTKHLRSHDNKLFAKKHDGVIHVFRRANRYASVAWESGTLVYSYEDRDHVTSLTDTWGIGGNPVDWGIEPVLQRIKEIDGHNRSVLEEMLEQSDKAREQKERDNKNRNEAFLRDFRKPFQKAFNDFNVAQMKSDNRRKRDY